MREPEERARRVLTAAGVDPGRPAAVRPLGGGTCSTVEEPRLTDGTRCVLKTAPTAPGPRHETRLPHSEAVFGRAAEEAGVPAPRTLHADDGPEVRHLLQTACPGTPWDDSLARPLPRVPVPDHAGRDGPASGRRGALPRGPGHRRAGARRRAGRDQGGRRLAHHMK